MGQLGGTFPLKGVCERKNYRKVVWVANEIGNYTNYPIMLDIIGIILDIMFSSMIF